MAADGGVMLSLDEALSELGNLFYTFGGFLQVCCLAKTPPPLFWKKMKVKWGGVVVKVFIKFLV